MKTKTNVLHIISSLEKKGPVQVIYDLIKNSDFENFNFILLALKPCIDSSLKNEFAHLQIKIIEIENVFVYDFIKFNKIVSDIILKENILICHTHCTRSLMINVFNSNKLSKFHSIQIYPGLQSKTMNGNFLGLLINLFTKKALKYIDYPISCSKYVHDALFNNDKIETKIIVNGSNSNYNKGLTKLELKKKLGFEMDYKYLISVGRLSPEKNFSFLIKSFMNNIQPGYKLVIIGDGDLETELKLNSNEDILILGFKSNFEDYIYASDYYVSSSLTEGMPLSVLIAMEAGLPLLLSNIPAHVEIFDVAKKEDKLIGQLFELNDNKLDLISLLQNFNTDKIIEDVKSIYINNFTSTEMSKKYNNLYTESLKKKNYV